MDDRLQIDIGYDKDEARRRGRTDKEMVARYRAEIEASGYDPFDYEVDWVLSANLRALEVDPAEMPVAVRTRFERFESLHLRASEAALDGLLGDVMPRIPKFADGAIAQAHALLGTLGTSTETTSTR